MIAFDPWLLLDPLPLLAAAVLVGRCAWRLAGSDAAGASSTPDRLTRAVVLGALVVTVSVALLGAAGWLGAPGLLGCALAAWGASRLATPRRGRRRHTRGGEGGGARGPWIVLALLVAAEAWSVLPTPPTNWDAMTYHLYFAARWVQEGAVFHIPTVFSDPNAAYAPQTGALIYAWVLALAAHDALCNVLQVLLLVPMAVAAFGMALRLGLARSPRTAAWGVLPLVLLPPLRRWAGSANVDVLQAVFFVLALALAVELAVGPLRRKRKERRGTVFLCGAAAGLTAGSKVVGLSLCLLPLAIAAAALLGRPEDRRGPRRLATHLGLLGTGFLAGGGWWYLKNLFLYGNPVFPLDVKLPGLHFPGAFTAETLRMAPFHVDPHRWLEMVYAFFGPAALLLAAAGLGALSWHVLRGREGYEGRGRGIVASPMARKRVAAGLVLFVPLWTSYELFVIPFNNQVRFLIPAFLVAGLGWARVVDRLPRRLGAAATLVFCGWLWAAALPRSVWSWRLDALAAALPRMVPWLAILGLLLASLAAAVGGRRRFPRAALALAALASWALVVVSTGMAETSRVAFLAREDYAINAPGFLVFHHPDLAPLDVAYAGCNIPYALMGRNFRHRVVYVPTRGESSWGLYEHWRDDPRLWETPLPTPYRGPGDDPERWVRRLGEEGIDFVAVFFLIEMEYPAHGPRDGIFPIERKWMRERPERFERLVRASSAEVYRVLP